MLEERNLGQLAAMIGDRRVVPVNPPNRTARAGSDDPDQVVRAVEPDESASWSAFITYRNAKGEESERAVTLRKVTGHFGEPESIYCYCHHRKALRQFRLDRISEMACVVTGEILDPFEHCRELVTLGALKIEDKALTQLMRLLVFMARCDGDFHLLEQNEMENLMLRYCLRFGGDDAMMERAIVESGRLAPDAEDLIKSLRAFAGMPEGPRICRFALESSGMMIDADGRHTPEEVTWAVEVSSALKRIADRG